MSKQEIMCTTVGEMLDMISCDAIYRGDAKPAKPKLTQEQIYMME